MAMAVAQKLELDELPLSTVVLRILREHSGPLYLSGILEAVAASGWTGRATRVSTESVLAALSFEGLVEPEVHAGRLRFAIAARIR